MLLVKGAPDVFVCAGKIMVETITWKLYTKEQ